MTEDRKEYVNELQMKKKFLEEKFCTKLLIMLVNAQRNAIDARKNLMEAREKLHDTQNIGINEATKFNSIRNDVM